MQSKVTIDVCMVQPKDGIESGNSGRCHVSRGEVGMYVVVKCFNIASSSGFSAHRIRGDLRESLVLRQNSIKGSPV